MRVVHGLSRIRKFKRPVVALGVFDGVHVGHRHILREAVRKARAIKGTSVVITFHPHPQEQESLYSLNHRLRLIAELGVATCVVIKFNAKFSRLSAEDFVKNILLKKIGAEFIYVGKNFRFGKRTEGDVRLLEKLSAAYNYKVKTFDVIRINNQPISSTYIRKLITQGKIHSAEKLLQRPVTVLGTVVKGISLAKKIGFPTANIDPHHEILLPSGVYAAKVIFNNKTFQGACNIGIKPTLRGHKSPTCRTGRQVTCLPACRGSHKLERHVEVFIFNFNKNIYGEDLEIQFIRKIRDEKKFASIGLLAGQIRKDIIQAQEFFSCH